MSLSCIDSGQVVHSCASVTKQYNLVLVKEWHCCGAGKLTACLVESWQPAKLPGWPYCLNRVSDYICLFSVFSRVLKSHEKYWNSSFDFSGPEKSWIRTWVLKKWWHLECGPEKASHFKQFLWCNLCKVEKVSIVLASMMGTGSFNIHSFFAVFIRVTRL